MNELDDEQNKNCPKGTTHLETLGELKSSTWGGPGGRVSRLHTGAIQFTKLFHSLVLPPYRILRNSRGRPWRMKPRDQEDLVFCHNDLSANNAIVDRETLKIKTIIIDWEYGGFYTPEFESHFSERPGLSVALDGEVDNTDALTSILAEASL